MTVAKAFMEARSAARVKRQLDIGRFKISLRDGTPVGEVVVVEDPLQRDSPNAAVEHWFLRRSFPSPGAEHRDVELRFQFVDSKAGTDGEVLVHELKSQLGEGDTYIEARCTIHTK